MKPKVLQLGKFYPPEWGGMETHVSGLSLALAHEYEISVLVANRGRSTIREQINGIPVIRAGTFLKLGSTPLCPSMVRLIQEIQPDLLHLHVPNPGGVLAIMASGYKGPIVVTYHSDVIRQKMLNIAYQPVMDRLLARSRAIIATSSAYVDSSQVLRRFANLCHVIPLGIDLESLPPESIVETRKIRSRYPGPLILGVGRLVYYKGFEYLIRAMQQVQATLLLIGKGSLRPSLEKLVSDCGLSGRVHILGNIVDAAPYYHAADLFVLPSIAPAEAFGIAQLEAMACGKPVINTQIASAVPFVSLHGVTGLTVPPCDVSALGAAINELIAREDLRRQFGGAGRRRVEEEFTLKKMAQRTIALYQDVLNGNRESGKVGSDLPAQD